MANLRVFIVFAIAVLLGGCGRGEQARHELAFPWSLGGRWLIADLHMHTRFSDGGLSVEELVGRAALNGCDAIALTDHGDPATSVSPEFFEHVEATRRKLPDLVLLVGLEWNIPPYGGREHVNVIVDPFTMVASQVNAEDADVALEPRSNRALNCGRTVCSSW